MNSSRLFVLFIFSLFTLSACHSDPSVHGFNFSFENLTDKPINLRIYKSQSDYYAGANVYLSGRMNVREYYTIPVDQLQKGENYYVDWYSDDLLYTNWYWSNITLRTAFAVSDNDYAYLVNTVQYPDPSRNIWMNGLGVQTTWKATDAFTVSGTSYTSVWSTLTPARQNVQIIFNKDFSAHLLMQNSSNQAIDSVLSYRPNYAFNVSTITLLNAQSDTVGIITSNFSPSTHTFTGDNTAAFANIWGIGYYQVQLQ